MAAFKTHNFLPEIFQTEPNKKFLNATVDQLITEPNFKRISGYIGRKFAPTYKTGDSYIVENDSQRQNYQLEPSLVIINPETNDVNAYCNYPDSINTIKYYGGNVDNHSRLFENEMYSYDGKFDFDKFVNFSQYYWLPNGPDAVLVTASGVALDATYTVKLNSETGNYYFTDSTKNSGDETLVLARGGVYNFNLDGTSGPFWIQSKAGISGVDPQRPNISTRNVYGVTNNGASIGTVTFIAPQTTSQSVYSNMPLSTSVDYATELAYRDIQGATVADINKRFNGLDGTSSYLDGKKVIFVGPDIDDYFWTAALTDQTVVSLAERTKTWLISVDQNTQVVTLVSYDTVNKNEQVYVKSGDANSTKYFYVDYHSHYVEVPQLTAGLDTLYYQNGDVSTAVGSIILVDPATVTLDPANDIIGKVNYTSPTGVVFSNGLKIRFDSSAIGGYADSTYYVAGVGKSIKLVPIGDMMPVEQWTNSTVEIGGSDYTINDILTVVGGTGTAAKLVVESINKDRATATATVSNGSLDSVIKIVNAGSGYTSAPRITISPPDSGVQVQGVTVTGVTATATALITDGKVSSVILTEAGSGYSIPPTITFTDPTTGAVSTFNIIDGGDYSTLPTNPASVTGGTGNNAKVNLVLQPETKDYLTIDRSSIDINAWSRSNRWFHADIIKATAAYNNTTFVIDQKNIAVRPIIEFEPNLQLFKYGSVAKKPIDILDTVITNAYTQVENIITPSYNTFTVTVNSNTVVLHDGDRVIFSNDTDDKVRNKIYNFKIVNVSENTTPIYIGSITETGEAISAGNNVLAKRGVSAGKEYYYDGTAWVSSQQKTGINQAPRFDMFDDNDISFGDTNTYVNSSFTGTTILEYKVGTGGNDVELGFPLSYRTFNNVGDIQFTNSYDTDTFAFLVSPQTVTLPINGGFLHTNIDKDTFTYSNIWTTAVEKSKQYQIISHTADGVNNLFEIDILPNPTKTVPNIKVFLNNKFVTVDNFGLSQIGARYAVLINPTLLTAGDSIDILIYSDSVSQMGYYEVPPSLDNNSENMTFESLTLGQIRNHLVTLSRNAVNITGAVPGNNNLRDISIKQQGGSIVKHSAPAIYGQLSLFDNTLNLMDSMQLAQKEYSKFKNKFLEIASQLHLEKDIDIAETTDTILKTINGIKNSSFPWYYSDMVPYGDNKKTLPPYTVLDPRIRSYELSTMFDDTVLSNKAVLVYLTRTANGITAKRLLAKDQDYTFSKVNPSFTISDKFNLNYGDILTVVEYSDTDGNYIPETPTKLGFYPKFTPVKFSDSSYVNPTNVIQGHDGSITIAFNDYRDDLLMELEMRIFDNIKIDYKMDFVVEHTPGKFRVTDYSLAEFNQVLTNNFLTWVGNNRIDYTTNSYFDEQNPWTYNYKNFKDSINAEYLPGTWRAVFKWFYDTDRPHTHPWEMLGFSSQPDWWVDRYGPAPYTGGNLNLWSDLSIGYIHAGPRAGLDSRYARPSLLQIIPVDESGNLISPDKFATINFNIGKANASFAVGDQGPVEAAWRRSSEYPFALQMAYALTKPGKYFGLLSDVSRYVRNNKVGQYLYSDSKQHLQFQQLVLNGTDDGTGNILRASSYSNWMVDYVTSTGVAMARDYVYGFLNNLTVKLSYKAAGYTDKNYLKVLAEQGSPSSTNDSIIIPDENYRVFLNQSTPVDRLVYSAVIIEKTTNGYTVSGYALNQPYFTIVPSLANNNQYTITSGKLVGTIYKDYQKVLVKIPYGYEFTTNQQVVDFLVGYQRYLQSKGFLFVDKDPTMNTKKDWILSATEFLTWSQQGWKEKNILVLSPVNDTLRVATADSVVGAITGAFNSSKLLDPNFAIIKPSAYSVSRIDNDFSVTTIKNQTICLAELNLVQYEHVLIFDNTTVFNDIIYSPDTGNRQYRLKMVGYKTADWTGALNPPGFIYNTSTVDEWQPGVDYKKGQLVTHKTVYYTALSTITASDTFQQTLWKQINQSQIKTGLLQNFGLNAQVFENIYDVDNPAANENINFYSSGLTGFRERSYLTDLGIDVQTQTKFYQGYIKQKGTKESILALSQAKLANIDSQLNVYEEWAMRVGEYGATDSNEFVEINLDEFVATSNPMALEFINENDSVTSGTIGYKPSQYYKSSGQNSPLLFKEYVEYADNPELPVAGYVNVNDVDATIFDMANYRDLTGILSNIGTGYTIWTAKDFEGSWNVFRVSETENMVAALTYNIDNVATFTTSTPHGLLPRDIVAVKGFNTTYDGFYQVYNVDGNQTFSVVLGNNYTALRDANTVYGSGMLFKLTSSRIASPSNVDDITPKFGWINDDKVWVDSIDSLDNWGVYNKTSPWTPTIKVELNASEYQPYSNFGSSVRVSPDGRFMYVGAAGSGRAAVFVKVNKTYVENSTFVDTTWAQNGSLTIGSTNTDEFGKAVEFNEHSFIIAAPGSNSGIGYAFVYAVDPALGITINQVLTSPSGTSASGRFAESIATSEDGAWLYVSEPGEDKVHVYTWTPMVGTDAQSVASGTTTTALDNPTTYASDILVNGRHPYVPNVDYTVSGNNITFTPALTENVTITYNSHYTWFTTLTEPNGLTNISFGKSIKTNPSGTQLVIGASEYNVAQGAAYVFDRSVERFIATGYSNTFTLENTLGSTYTVLVNGIQTTNYTVYNNTVHLNDVPAGGSVIDIETNAFNYIQKLTGVSSDQSQQMGYAVDICKNTCSVYASAPYYRTSGYSSGAVYRFVNQGKLYGSIIGTIKNPTITVHGSIRVNGITVQFAAGDSLSAVISKINAATIAGVVASNLSGYLKIDSSTTTALNKLDILPCSGTALYDLGLNPFTKTQLIKHPGTDNTELFGTTIRISDDAATLAVGSLGANTIEKTTFDASSTVFDADSTIIRDHISNSGAVYIFNLMANPFETAASPSQMAYVQELLPSGLGTDFKFGASIDFRNNHIYVGASADNSLVDGGGSVFEFINQSTSGGWDLVRYKTPRVDVDALSKAFIYNKNTQTILSHLEVFDPVKGRILGIAEQDLDFKSEQDPATYNNGFLNYSPSYHWNNQQVGKTWWDLSQVRFIDYEQDSLNYKNKHWGDTFPGSTIAVYEWVESSVLPSQYVANGGNGVPKFADDSNYVTYTYVESATGIIKNNYYFWVSGKTTVDTVKTNKLNSVYSIQQIISNPRDQGIPYISLIAPNAVGLYNVNNSVTGTDIALHLDYSSIPNSNIIHSEYELIKEGASNTIVPTRIVNKLRDSLAGVDGSGLLVPDPQLRDSEKYGIDIRPRQSIFVNRLSALENFIKYANSVFVQHPIADQFSLEQLNSGEPIPPANTGAWDIAVATNDELTYLDTAALADGYLVLVNSDLNHDGLWVIYKWLSATAEWMVFQVQSYLTSLYYSLADWYSSDFDNTIAPTYTVAKYVDIKKLSLVAGDTIRVNDNGDSRFAYYRVASDLTLDRVGSQNGTIQLSPALYNLSAANMGFDNDSFDTIRFDQTPSIETRYVFSSVYEDLLIKDLRVEFNNLFFGLINYIFSEQKAPDWVFKSSFISVQHRIRELAQYPSYIKDNQTFYEDYINEVKPYRTTIREYVPSQSGTDYLHAGTTDFDVPAYYDTLTGTYRQPNGDLPTDANLLTTSDYVDWNDNHKYKVTEIAIDNGGTGYTFTPNVTISGGGGSGATAIATIANGSIHSIVITNPGANYTSTPSIYINGNGTGAIAYPILRNEYYDTDAAQSYNTIRNVSTTIKFDRTAYTSDVVEWAPNTAYTGAVTSGIGDGNVWLSSGTLVSYNNEVYLPQDANSTSETTFDGSLYEKVNAGNVLLNTNDRIMGYYSPMSGMPGKDLAQLVDGIEYSGVFVQGVKYPRTNTNGSTLPAAGLDYPFTSNVLFANANVSFSDSTITSSYLDSALGTRPEDINIDGGAYVDVYNSHAPEELLPGMVFDTLEMKVLTADTSAFSSAGFTIDRVIMTNIGFGYDPNNITVTVDGIGGAQLTPVLAANGAILSLTIDNAGSVLAANANPTVTITGPSVVPATASAYLGQSTYDLIGYRLFRSMDDKLEYTRVWNPATSILTTDLAITDTLIHVADASVFQEPSIELATPGIVFINGERISYYTRDTQNNTLGQIRRGVAGTGAPLVHATGTLVSESGLAQVIPDTAAPETQTFTGDGTTTNFVTSISELNANLTAYISSVSVTVNDVKQDFVLNATTPYIDVTLFTAPAIGDSVHVSASFETIWLNPPPSDDPTVPKLFVTGTGADLVTNTGAQLYIPASGVIGQVTDGSGLIGSVSAQAKFIKGIL